MSSYVKTDGKLSIFLILTYYFNSVFENKYITLVFLLYSHCFVIILILCLPVAHNMSQSAPV
jgi:hypothetical protein